MNYSISELKTNNNHLDIFKAKINIEAKLNSKNEYKKWLYWKDLPQVTENETEDLKNYIYGLRNTSTIRDIDFDYNKYLRLQTANLLTSDFFPNTLTYGRGGIGHYTYEVINPITDQADEKIFFGDRTILEFRSVGAFQVLKGQLDNNGSTAKISTIKITQIEYKTLKKKFYEAGMLAQMLIGCPGTNSVINGYLKPIIGEMGWAGVKQNDAERYIKIFLKTIDREDREKETINSLKSYYKNEKFSKLKTKEGLVHDSCLWSNTEILHFQNNLKKIVGKKEKKLSKITTGEEVWSTEAVEVNQIIDRYFCEGLTIVAGRPKGGKSWLMLNASLAVENDLKFLGEKVKQTRCLYYALEDNSNRLKRRWGSLGLKDQDRKPDIIYLKDLQNKLGDGLEDEIETYIKESGYKLIVIDTYAKAKSSKINLKVQYDVDTKSLSGLQELGLRYGVAIVVIHHTRKPDRRDGESDEFDAISGTSGIQGVADTLIVLTSKRKSKDVTKLFLTSRDLEPLEKEIKLDSSFWWEVIGNVGDDNTAKQTVLQDHIIEAVKWWTVKPISNSTAKLFEEDAIKKIPKNENIIQACSPKQICEYFVLAQTLNIHNEPYKESTIKKETQRMRDKYNLLQSGVDPHTYRLQSF